MNVVFQRSLATTTSVDHEPRVEVHHDGTGDYVLVFQHMEQAVIANRMDACRVANTICEIIEAEL